MFDGPIWFLQDMSVGPTGFRKDCNNKSDFIFLNSCDGFWPISLYWSYKTPSRDKNFNDMQPRIMLANLRIESLLEQEKRKVALGMVLQYTLVYITNIMPMFIQTIAVLKMEIFHEKLSVLKPKTVFVDFLWYVISCSTYS